MCLTTLPTSCGVVTKSGYFNFLKSSGPLQACNGTDLPLYYSIINICLEWNNFSSVNTESDLRITFKGRHSARWYIKTVRTAQRTQSASVKKTKSLNQNIKRPVSTTIFYRKHITYFGSIDPSAGVHKFDIYRKMPLIRLDQRIKEI